MCPSLRGSTVHKEEDNLSVVDTKWLVPMCPLFRGSTVHKEEDNLSIVDKMTGPNAGADPEICKGGFIYYDVISRTVS